MSRWWWRTGVAAGLPVLLLLAASRLGGPIEGAAAAPAAERLTPEGIRPRPARAATGSIFARRTAPLSGAERQQAAVGELIRGNLPEFLRHFRPVSSRTEDGEHEAVVWVMPDYLAIGSDDDFLRMPLTYYAAADVLDRFGCVLPTTRIVDAVYQQAALRLKPAPLPPGPRMRSVGYFLRHRGLIESQRAHRGTGELTAGHKKDVVMTSRLTLRPGRIAIYGWHRGEGDPIQPLSTVHGARYADYSHGIRPVYATVWVNGEPRSIYEVLADPRLAPLLSDEGPIPEAWRLMHPEPPPATAGKTAR